MRSSKSLIARAAAGMLVLTMALPGLVFSNVEAFGDKKLTDEQKIAHVLNRLNFGARPGDIEKVKAIGLQKYIDQQLSPSSINDAVAETKVKNLEIFGMTTAEVFEKYPNPGALLRALEGRQNNNQQQQAKANEDMTDKERQERQQKTLQYYSKYDLRPAREMLPQIVSNRVLRAVYSERQLQEVMVDFWQNHFNVFSGKAAVRWYIPSYERDVLRKNALGNFKDLVVGTAQHPAMLFYLDNFESISPNAGNNNRRGNGQRLRQILRRGDDMSRPTPGMPQTQMPERPQAQMPRPQQQQQQRRAGINENYARELMELHTLGVDGGYTQKDIVEVAKAFTGWTIADARGYRRAAAREITGMENRQIERLQRIAGVPDDLESGQFYFNPRWHDDSAKTVLGQKVDEGGINDGLKVIDILVKHPSTAKFIAKKLAVKFVSDNPSEALVKRVAEAFTKSNGDIKTTLRAVFTDKEFFATENYRAKIKTPFELAISSIRALGGDTQGGPAMLAMLNKLGEVPYGYQAPTGYPDTAEDWVNTGALLERLNWAIAVASNRIPGTRVDLKGFDPKDRAKMLDQAIGSILGGEVSPTTKATLQKQLEQPLPEVKAANEVDDTVAAPEMRGGGQGNRGGGRQARLLNPTGNAEVFKVVSLVLGTPEFQRQ